jgi:hypothetical protein
MGPRFRSSHEFREANSAVMHFEVGLKWAPAAGRGFRPLGFRGPDLMPDADPAPVKLQGPSGRRALFAALLSGNPHEQRTHFGGFVMPCALRVVDIWRPP